MKKIMILIIAVVFALPLITHTAAAVPDSCLKMIWPNDRHKEWDEEWLKWKYVGDINPDSVRVDSCEDSPTYLQKFAKRYYDIQFVPPFYPFDDILDTNEIKEVSEISQKHSVFKQKMQNMELKFGKLYFEGLENKYPDSNYFYNPLIRLYFKDYQNIKDVEAYFTENVDSLIKFVYADEAINGGWLLDIYDTNIKVTFITPNPSSNFIFLNMENSFKNEDVFIYDINGKLVGKYQNTDKIDVSTYPKGVYIVQIGNNSCKFIKE